MDAEGLDLSDDLGINLLYRTDCHVADKSPESWKGDYCAEILGSLRQIGDLSKIHKVLAVLDGGDLFHHKNPTKTPYWLIRELVQIHRDYETPTYGVVGNHDIQYNDHDSIGRQPLGVLHITDVLRPLDDIRFSAHGITVRVTGIPYSPTLTANMIKSQFSKGDETYWVMLLHQLASPNGNEQDGQFMGETVLRYSDLIWDGGPDVFCFGHWHKDQGIELIEGRHFVNVGAVSRGALNNDNLSRIPKVALLHFDRYSYGVEPIDLKVAAPQDVYDLDRKAKVEQREIDLDRFIQQLEGSITINSMESIEHQVERLEFAKDVKEMALMYLSGL